MVDAFDRLMKRSLLERLGLRKPRPDDGLSSPLRTDEEADVRLSICDNLRVLLGSREGLAPAWPQYGLPDLLEIVTGIPDRERELELRIAEAVRVAEPRLEHLQVSHVQDKSDPLTVRFLITARLKDTGDPLTVETVLAPALRVKTL